MNTLPEPGPARDGLSETPGDAEASGGVEALDDGFYDGAYDELDATDEPQAGSDSPTDELLSEDAVLAQLESAHSGSPSFHWGAPADTPGTDEAHLSSAQFHSGAPAGTPAAADQAADAPPEPDARHTSLPAAVRELLNALIAELPQVSIVFDQLVGLAGATDVEADVFANALDNATDMIARLGATTESLGLLGLGHVCGHLRHNLDAAAGGTQSRICHATEIWQSVLPAIRRYLESPYESARGSALVALLTDSRLAVPINAAGALSLLQELARPEFATLDLGGPTRPQLATPEDVSLALPDDANPELVEALLHELPQQTEELSAAVQRLVSGGSLEDVTVAQRIAHTIKGAGNTVGVRGLAELTHQLEDVLLALAKHETLPSAALGQTLIAASDCLQAMAEALQGAAPAPAESLAVLQDVLDWANRIDHDGPPADGAPPPASSLDVEAERAHNIPVDQPSPAAPEGGSAIASPAQKPPETEASSAVLRVSSSLIDDLLRLVGEAMIQNGQLQERVRGARQEARAMSRQFDLLQQIGSELEELIDLRDLSTERQHRSDDRAFDALELDQYNELHTHSRRLIEAAVDAREIGRSVIDNLGELNDMLVTQERLNRDTQDGVLRTRMVAVKTVFPRFERSVRQTCRLTGKQVELHLSGGDTHMDSDVLGRIVDPVMHVLRNAIDHGIEDADLRQGLGKPPGGHIQLQFLRDGNSILVRCRDDGAGLDFAAIREVAQQRGFIAPGSDVGDEVLKQLILLPNFTTRSRATQVSGRGIGLDAVHTSVVALGGSLTLHSVQERGCTVEIRLPVSLLSSNALLVRAAGQVVALASRGIEQIRHIQDGELRQFGTELVFHTGEQVLPARSLETVLELSTPASTMDDPRSVLIVRTERGVHAVLVKSVIASRDVVVKTLGRYIPKLRGIVGATILGDGSVTPVIDLAEMLRAPATAALEGTTTLTSSSADLMRSRRAFVVDDSLSARRSMAQVLGDSGFEVFTARDGMEAVELLEQTRPDIMFVDLEMPRMNGIELTSHVRARPETARVPVVMITSRSTEKHRTQARAAGVDVYLTKPFDADTLLEQAERLMDVP